MRWQQNKISRLNLLAVLLATSLEVGALAAIKRKKYEAKNKSLATSLEVGALAACSLIKNLKLFRLQWLATSLEVGALAAKI